jgi:hypothetical protein
MPTANAGEGAGTSGDGQGGASPKLAWRATPNPKRVPNPKPAPSPRPVPFASMSGASPIWSRRGGTQA